MQKSTLIACLVLTIAATAEAQCNRGSGARSAGMTNGLTNSLAPFSPTASVNPALMAAQYRAQLARYQQLAQRQQLALARQQRSAKARFSAGESAFRSGFTAGTASNDRKERLRQENAEKAYRLALRAEDGGRKSSARSLYRRVVRITGQDSPLGKQATSALAALDGRPEYLTMTVSNEL